MTAVRLPDKLYELIDIGLADLEKCRQNPERFTIRMCNWVVPTPSGCRVCLAGAVMVQRLDALGKRKCIPNHYDSDTCHKLIALDRARRGSWSLALEILIPKDPTRVYWNRFSKIKDRLPQPADYYPSPEQFFQDMRLASELLREVDL